MAKRLLITGFDSFGNIDANPSQLAVEQLPDTIGCFRLDKLTLPTVYGTAAQMVLERAEAFRPHLILCIGVAEGRDAVTPERIAVNIRDARIPDNRGNQPQGDFVVPDGPAAYFATVPVEKMAQAIRDAQIPARVSNTAGAFVCNDVMYSVLHHCAQTDTLAGFIHVPALPKDDRPALPLEQTIRALTAAILACS